MLTRRLFALFLFYVCVILTAATVFDVAEGSDFGSSAWWAIVTATTVGYGDLSPTTATGRVVAVVLMLTTSLVILPLLTAEIAAKLIVDNDAFTHDEQEEIKLTLRRIEERLDQLHR